MYSGTRLEMIDGFDVVDGWFDPITNAVTNAGNVVTNAGNVVTNAGNWVWNGTQWVQKSAGNVVTNAGNAVTNAGNWVWNGTQWVQKSAGGWLNNIHLPSLPNFGGAFGALQNVITWLSKYWWILALVIGGILIVALYKYLSSMISLPLSAAKNAFA